ncbi:MAG: hypothetical protein ACK56F_13790 [bacterium]
MKTIKACKNAGSKAEPNGRGVEKVTVVASPTRKYFSRRTGNAKLHAGSCFDFDVVMRHVHACVVGPLTQPALVQRQQAEQRTVH